jgi:hypothetical protein
MNLLSPRKLQALLYASHSVKTNRVMLYLARRNAHPYFQYLNQSVIETGTGKRQIVPGAGWSRIIKSPFPAHLKRKESKMALRDSYARQVFHQAKALTGAAFAREDGSRLSGG